MESWQLSLICGQFAISKVDCSSPEYWHWNMISNSRHLEIHVGIYIFMSFFWPSAMVSV